MEEVKTSKPAEEGEYTAIRACYYSDGVYRHKYFTEGEVLPEGWIPDANGCTHFKRTAEAKKIIKTGTATQKANTAGDDKRSTKDIRAALQKFMKTPVPLKWKRKEMWGKLVERENAEAKDAVTSPKEKK